LLFDEHRHGRPVGHAASGKACGRVCLDGASNRLRLGGGQDNGRARIVEKNLPSGCHIFVEQARLDLVGGQSLGVEAKKRPGQATRDAEQAYPWDR
jgi:hypothetical protein